MKIKTQVIEEEQQNNLDPNIAQAEENPPNQVSQRIQAIAEKRIRKWLFTSLRMT